VTLFVTDDQGHQVAGQVLYDEKQEMAYFLLAEPLARNKTYTVTLTTAIRDSSGNALAKPYTWQFSTWSFKVYLPMAVR